MRERGKRGVRGGMRFICNLAYAAAGQKQLSRCTPALCCAAAAAHQPAPAVQAHMAPGAGLKLTLAAEGGRAEGRVLAEVCLAAAGQLAAAGDLTPQGAREQQQQQQQQPPSWRSHAASPLGA
jgi:hypothetical protein